MATDQIAPSLRRSDQARLTDRATVRLALFAGGLVVALIAGFGLGRATSSPTAGSGNGGAAMPSHAHPSGSADGHTHPGSAVGGADVGGLSASSLGYRLVPQRTALPAGRPGDLRFQIEGPDRRPVTDFSVVHDKLLHLFVVRRDLSGFQHLHPTMSADGTWLAPVTLAQPGSWRAIVDFSAVAANGVPTPVTLGVDLSAAGDYRPTPLPQAARESTVDAMTVTYEGTPQVGASSPLLFRVFGAGGTPATDLERYLGAYGHLVVLRQGDVGFVHVHPEPELVGGAVKFWLSAPSPGTYRMFLDFQRAGRVHTVEYTLVVS